MSTATYPFREAIGCALAWLDQDDDLLAEILNRYELGDEELELVVSVVSLMSVDRDEGELADALYGMALAGAGRRPT